MPALRSLLALCGMAVVSGLSSGALALMCGLQTDQAWTLSVAVAVAIFALGTEPRT